MKIKNRSSLNFIFALIAILFLVSNSPLKITSINKDLNLCSKSDFFTTESINVCNFISKANLRNNLNFFTFSKLKYKNNQSFLKHILLLSGDVSLNPGPSQIPQLNSETWSPFRKRGLHFLHLNINSILPKIDELRHIAKTSKVSVIGISETKLDDTVTNNEINIEGYSVLRHDRNRQGGGVACYVRNDISFNQVYIFSNETENIFFEIFLPNSHTITVGIFYRPPNQNKFLDNITNDFTKLNTEKKEIIILGDININLLQNGKNILHENKNNFGDKNAIHSLLKQYKHFLTNFGLKQLIKTPTRVTRDTTTLIDHILTNSEEKISQSGVIDSGISDHSIIFCTRKIIKPKTGDQKIIQFRSFKNYSAELFEEALKDIDFPNYEHFSDIDAAYSDFIFKLTGVIDRMAPMRQSKIKNYTQEWFDEEVAEKINIREKCFKKFKKTKLHVDEEIFKEAQKDARNTINRKKKEYFEFKLTESIGKPKDLWKTIKGLGLESKSVSTPNVCLKENNSYIFDPKQVANIFKNFFSNLAKNLVSKLPPPPNKFGKTFFSSYYENLNIQSEFELQKLEEDTVLENLEKLKPKATGVDNISSRFLKDGANVLSLPITQLCNLSISTSSFPKLCKVAKLKPLYKKGSKNDPQNYRPISILPVVSKIIERVVHDQTNKFLADNNIMYKFQSGFRGNHSTNDCLSYLNDKILKGFDEGLLTGMILIDLQKAFDTIDHEVLFNKLVSLRFTDKTILWFKSYLVGRTFKVNIDKTLSDPGDQACGVPQGSILGPLLFLLYVNDMPQSVKCELFLYADDSCLVFQHRNEKVIEEQLNKDFANLCEWFVDNKLSIHFGDDKTKSILFASKMKVKKVAKLDITYNNVKIKQHSKVTYLGCILDETLNGESMALYVINKINAKIKFLYRKNRFLSPALRRLLCNAIIQPHFDYACATWYPSLNKVLKQKLQTAQNKCIRFCLLLNNRKHIGFDEFEKINWLNVNDRFHQSLAVSTFKFFNNKSPSYMSDIFVPSDNGRASTRNSFQKLSQPFRKTTQGQNAISYIGPSAWNKLPEQAKQCKTINSFKHAVKKQYFIDLKRKYTLGQKR